MKKFITLLSVMTVLVLSSVYASNVQDAAQSKAIKRLEAASKEAVKIEFDQRTNIPRFVNLRVPVSGALTAEAASFRFFEEYKELFKMSNPTEDLAVKDVQTDRLGMTYVKMRQSVNGIPVFGREMVVHINSNHEIYVVNGEFFPRAKVDEGTVPSVSPDLAIAAAKSDIGPAVYRWDTVFEQMLPAGKSWRPAAELMIYEHEKQFRLVYRTMIAIEEPEPANWVYFIDAKTGEVLHRYNDLKSTDVVGTGNSLYRGAVPINTNQTSPTNFEMKDNLQRQLWTYDNNNRGDQSLPGTLFTDSDNVWGDGTNSNRQSAGVDAHWGAAITYGYYLSNHGRQSVDDSGLRITSSVHYKRNLVNAYWNGAQMLYGDGDGVTATPLVDLDVVAHELTHGVTQYSANLIYQNQSGALNESVSDIFAMFIDADDYTIGEDSWLASPGYLRSMSNPTLAGQPKHMEDYVNTTSDNGGVHTNSGIPNFAAYLMTAGGSGKYPAPVVTGIGRTKASDIWYLALTGGYMTASTDFAGARSATVTAATVLYGANSTEVQTVKNAWTAVGVNEPPPPPSDFTGTFVAHSYSTPHPYRNRRTYTHTITHTGAIGMKVSLQNFATEADYDFVYIKDGSGTTIYTYHGSLGNFVSGPVNGETITVQLVTDQLVNDYGFDIDGYYWNDPANPGITGLTGALPDEYALEQNYPNPFNPTTSISYQLPEAAKVSLNIYDMSGQLVKTLVDEEQSADSYIISWDATNKAGSKVANGIYFYKLRAGNFTQTRRMVLLK